MVSGAMAPVSINNGIAFSLTDYNFRGLPDAIVANLWPDAGDVELGTAGNVCVLIRLR
jgi:hypothetical protein